MEVDKTWQNEGVIQLGHNMNLRVLMEGVEEQAQVDWLRHVRYRPELVTLRLEDDVNPLELTGNYLSPKEFYEAMQNEDTVVIDARNDYEFDLGHFRDSVRPETANFARQTSINLLRLSRTQTACLHISHTPRFHSDMLSI